MFDLYVELNISFADAYHAVMAEALGIQRIYSWDRDLDQVKGLQRVEP